MLPDFYDEFDEDELEDGKDAPDQLEADSDETPDDRIPAWSANIKYKNGTEQSIKGFDYIPDPVMSVFLDFEEYFEDELSSEDIDGEGFDLEDE